MHVEDNHRTKGLIRLTMACNERCTFCNVPMEDYPIKTSSPEQIQRELDVFLKDGHQSLAISGGEPTLLRDRLLSLITKARKGGIRFVELQTNAILLDKDYVRALKEAGLTSAFVSFLSHIPERHDELAGLKGAYQRCIDGTLALIRAGVSVTLNPVISKSTQELVPDYVDFVAETFPGISAISFSAVQPHGRAAQNLDLLPDYAVLKRVMPLAIDRAKRQGIKPLNPFCGLPLCVGWTEDSEQCVEWQESLLNRDDSPESGLENKGNKSHGTPCFDCVFRSRCGGAWHAYWQARSGSGISPPVRLQNPLVDRGSPHQGQSTVFALKGVSSTTFSELKSAKTPTRWLVLHHFSSEDIESIANSEATELAVYIDGRQLQKVSPSSLATIKRIKDLKNALSSSQQMHLVVSSSQGAAVQTVRELARRFGIRNVAIMGAL